ncbi:aspartic peptidase domain-containing protein [Scheffersomyces coipomensis]|uniref:aspartic peptidase domain-containing protein n=1 Tax=Scheffersomyces coipomensis TaxID=1788519 RepID=UPI00315DA6D0
MVLPSMNMKNSLLCLVAINYLSHLVSSEATGFKLDFQVKRANSKRELFDQDENHDHSPRILTKRDSNGYLNMEIQNEQTFYMAALKLGSNQDEVGVLVDTGSSDLWVMSHDLTCVDAPSQSKRQVVFEQDDEESSQDDDSTIQYVDDINEPEIDEEESNDNSYNEQDNDKQLQKRDDSASTTAKNWFWPFGGGSGGGGTSGYYYTTIYYTPGVGGGYPTQAAPTGTESYQTTNTCSQYGSFNTGNSDTWQQNSTADFEIQYADGTEAVGLWGNDKVIIGNTTVDSLSFAVVNTTSSNVGVLGIGLPSLEVTYANSVAGTSYTYQNLPLRLKALGITERNLYSIYLGRTIDPSGNVLFGAIDNAKISGNLTTLPILSTSGYNIAMRSQVLVNGITFSNGKTTETVSSDSYAAVLDTGTTLSFLPTALLQSLGQALGGTYSSSLGAYILPCTSDPNAIVAINFGGFKLNIPLGNLLIPATQSTCYLGIFSQTSNYLLLGDIVMRNAYWVYDFDNLEISVANVIYTTDEDIQVIGANENIPGAVRAADFSQTNLGKVGTQTSLTPVSYQTGKLTGSNANTAVVTTVTGNIFSNSNNNNNQATTTSSSTGTSSRSTSGSNSASTNTGSSSSGSSGSSSTGYHYSIPITFVCSLVAILSFSFFV